MEASNVSALKLVAWATLFNAWPTASGNNESVGGGTAEGDTTLICCAIELESVSWLLVKLVSWKSECTAQLAREIHQKADTHTHTRADSGILTDILLLLIAVPEAPVPVAAVAPATAPPWSRLCKTFWASGLLEIGTFAIDCGKAAKAGTATMVTGSSSRTLVILVGRFNFWSPGWMGLNGGTVTSVVADESLPPEARKLIAWLDLFEAI